MFTVALAITALELANGCITASREVQLMDSANGYVVSMRLAPIRLENNWRYWGESEGLNFGIQHLSVRLRGEDLFIPFSAFSDLLNVNSMDIKSIKSGVAIHINGADAHVSYDASIVVIGTEVVNRTVASGEFPENYRETTTYRNEAPRDL